MVSESLERVWRDERASIVGSLARRFGDFELAEDAVQEAFSSAHRSWPIDGEPELPAAWLQTVAHRKAIGMVRKRKPTSGLDTDDRVLDVEEARSRSPIDDDFLALLLACCHPALDSKARIALTLRHVCGLDVEEISAGFVVSESTMSKRLVRARRKIKQAGIPFVVPGGETIQARIGDIHTVIYMVFTEGHLASGQGDAVRTDLCEEAIWLARQIVDLEPENDESRGLLALLLFQHARHPARTDPDGRLIRLGDQDPRQWNVAAIQEARTLLADPDVATLGPYRVEAAIAALHSAADGPDWARIADLYAILSRLAPSPIVEINRSIAVGCADGPHAGLAIIEPILESGRLANYPHAHAAHAELLEQAGDNSGAVGAWKRAAAVSVNCVQRDAMTTRWQQLRSGDTSPR